MSDDGYIFNMKPVVERIESIDQKVERLGGLLEVILSNLHPQEVITIKEIAIREKVSSGTLYRGGVNRWMLPRFGENPTYGGRTLKWDMSEYEQWRAIPAEDRKAQYREHLRQRVIRAKKQK